MRAKDRIHQGDVPASVQVPYAAHVGERVVITESGDYLMTWRVGGISFECADDQDINRAHDRLNGWLRNLSSPTLSLWTHVVRRRERPVPLGAPSAGFASRLSEKYGRRIAGETLWVNELYITIVYRPPGARLGGLIRSLTPGRNPESATADRAAALAEFSKIASQVEASLDAYSVESLGCYRRQGRWHSSLLEFLAMLVNGECQPFPLIRAPIRDVLATSRLLFGWETIEYRMPTATRFGACLAFREYATPTTPGMLNRLLTMPFPYVLSQSFTFLSKPAAMGLLNRQFHRLRNAADAAVSQAVALKAALDQLGSNEFSMGDHHWTLQVLTEAKPASNLDARTELGRLEDSIAAARTVVGDAGFVVAREDIALEAAFWAQLPGNFAQRPRCAPITSRNFAALAPMHNYPLGRAVGNHWGEAVATLKTSAGSPFYFSLHASDPKDPDGGSRRDTGHTFLCGPTGSGKTVFLGFCVCMLQKFDATQVIFDKDHGLEILVRALGGEYLGFSRGAETGCNPLQLDATPRNRAFLRQWLVDLVGRHDRPLSPRDESELDMALEGLLSLPPAARRLSRLLEFLDPTAGDGIYARLTPWCHVTRGEYAAAFDTETDRIVPLLGRSSLLGFDMTDVLDDSVLRGPLTRYLFHILETLLDGRRLVVWLDEFAKLLSDAAFEALASDGTKTWRKRNGVIAFITQSPSDVLRSPIARTLIEQTPTKVFFPNPDAHRLDYVDGFGLTEREFELISVQLTPGSRKFLIRQGRDAVVAGLDLKGFDPELRVISGRAETVAHVTQLMKQFGMDPSGWLPRFLGDEESTTTQEAK